LPRPLALIIHLLFIFHAASSAALLAAAPSDCLSRPCPWTAPAAPLVSVRLAMLVRTCGRVLRPPPLGPRRSAAPLCRASCARCSVPSAALAGGAFGRVGHACCVCVCVLVCLVCLFKGVYGTFVMAVPLVPRLFPAPLCGPPRGRHQGWLSCRTTELSEFCVATAATRSHFVF
jgi:hypothetical protein